MAEQPEKRLPIRITRSDHPRIAKLVAKMHNHNHPDDPITPADVPPQRREPKATNQPADLKRKRKLVARHFRQNPDDK